jgi:very-short-patch-repair endonuclease
VARDQLLAAGITRDMITHRIALGMLIPVYDGVYLFGFGPRSPLADQAAAVLACRPRAFLSHVTATGLWDLPARDGHEIHVTVVARSRKSFANVKVHSISHLPRAELRRIDGLPVASPSLTILDIAGNGDADELLECLHEARVQRLVRDRELRGTLAAHPNRRGAKALRRLLDREGGVRITRSKAERRTLSVLRAHGLSPDASNVHVGPYTLDFFFRSERVAVEYDSRQFHDNERRFVGDRRKIAYLAGQGILTFPLTAHDLRAGAKRAMADLKATLDSRR